MKREKTRRMMVWVVLISLIASMIAVSCNGGEEPPPEEENPQYGGVLSLLSGFDTSGFDDAFTAHGMALTLAYTNEQVWEGDWTLGNAGGYGTKEVPWLLEAGISRMDYQTGAIAESWEMYGNGTIVLDIREGISWHDKPPTNGRNVTADDVAFSISRYFTLPDGFGKTNYPDLAGNITVSTPDADTVVIECPAEQFAELIGVLTCMHIFPRDAVEEHGDMQDWENSIGTGPFMLTNYVPDSEMTFVRNPNYWRTNPIGLGEGDQLPYLDGVDILVIEDISTGLAAFRTGVIDILRMGWEQAQEFLDNNKLEYVKYYDDHGGTVIGMRIDDPELPYYHKEVRQALMLAINHQMMIDELAGGEGILLHWPLGPVEEYSDAYVPLEELPTSVQELFTYDPDQAEDLLDAAGFPRDLETGVRFETSIICFNFQPSLDALQMVKAMWHDVGVELTIEPLDFTTFAVRFLFRNYDHMILGWYELCGVYHFARNYVGSMMWNCGYIDDPTAEAARDAMLAAYPDEDAVAAIHQELMPHLQEQAYVIQLPRGYSYQFWWRWVKNYNGESSLGYSNTGNFAKYVWIDQELMEAMGY
jgi:peptide/nickel transport system substrate-binding protein